MLARAVLGMWRRRRGIGLALCVALLAAAPAAGEEGFGRLDGHGGPVMAVAVSPDGARVLTGSFDYSVGVWSLSSTELLRWLDGHRAAVDAVAFLPDGSRALSAGDDFDLILWDVATGQRLDTMDGHRGKISSISVSPDGTMAASSGWDGWIGLWDLEGEAPVRWLKGHDGNVNDAVFTADGARLYSASEDGTIRRWDVAAGEAEAVLVRHGFGVNRLALNEAAGWLAYGAVDGAVRAIDLAGGEEIADLTADRRPILALAPSPDGRLLAVGDGEGYVTIISTGAESGGWAIERDFHATTQGPIWALAWTPDGRRLVSGGIDDGAAIWPVAAASEAVEGLLASAERSFLRDPAEMTNGERQFARKCSICHTLTPDGERRAGPTLHGLFGRRAGTVLGYSYSDALAGSDIIWDETTIDRLFDEGPDHYTPGSKMPMQRMTDPQDRRDLIEFLAKRTDPDRKEVTE